MPISPLPPRTASTPPTSSIFDALPSAPDPRLPSFISARLRHALRLPSAHPWVSSFLFSSLTPSIFHPSTPLSASSLSLSASFHSLRELSAPSRRISVPVFADLVFAPVHESADVTVGYALALVPSATDQSPHHDHSLALSAPPFAPPFIARFAFDPRHRALLMALRATQPDVVAVNAVVWDHGKPREQYCFALPPAEYGEADLPTTVLAMMSNVEYRLDDLAFPSRSRDHARIHARRPVRPAQVPAGPPTVVHGSRASRPPMPQLPLAGPASCTLPGERHDTSSFLSNLLRDAGALHSPRIAVFAEETSSQMSFPADPMRWDPVLDDVIGSPRAQQGVDMDLVTSSSSHSWRTSSGASDEKRLSRVMKALESTLTGKFYGPSVRMDSLHILTGHYTSMLSGKITYALDTAEESASSMLRQTFAQVYYLSVLSVSADNRLLVNFVEHGVPFGSRNVQSDVVHPGGAHPFSSQIEACAAEIEIAGDDVLNVLTDSCSGHATSAGLAEIVNVTGQGGRAHGKESGFDMQVCLDAISPVPTSDFVGAPVCETRESLLVGAKRVHVPVIAPKPTTPSLASGAICTTRENAAIKFGHDKQKDRGRESTDERRKRILEERKKRNRLSAARSNFRKKQQLEAVQREVGANRRRISRLTDRQRAIVAENERLKKLLSKYRQRPCILACQLEGLFPD